MDLRGYRDLKIYHEAFRLAMEVFNESKKFPPDERYSLTSQVRRSSRSVVANLAEGYRKRQYPNMFLNKLSDCDAEATETQVWLDLAMNCGYLSAEKHGELMVGYETVDKMLNRMMTNPERFLPSS